MRETFGRNKQSHLDGVVRGFLMKIYLRCIAGGAPQDAAFAFVRLCVFEDNEFEAFDNSLCAEHRIEWRAAVFIRVAGTQLRAYMCTLFWSLVVFAVARQREFLHELNIERCEIEVPVPRNLVAVYFLHGVVSRLQKPFLETLILRLRAEVDLPIKLIVERHPFAPRSLGAR